MVLNEPTGNPDPMHRKEFIKFFSNVDITEVLATHDADMVLSICNKVAIMDKGRIVAFDRTEKIFKDKGLLKSHVLD